MDLNSCLYQCRVYHKRHVPKKHVFEYNHFSFLLDLDELPLLDSQFKLFGHNKSALYRFNDSDHLEISNHPLKQRLQNLLRLNGIESSVTKIMLLANPRVMGYVFNPLSIYYCFDSRKNLVALVAEICNTFYERKAYVIKADKDSKLGITEAKHTKNFYISPFCKLDDQLIFRIQNPGDAVSLHVNTISKEGETVIETGLSGRRIDLTNANLLSSAWHYPLPTFATIARIHWQALLLYLKGVPHERKEANPNLQMNLFRPHKSLVQAMADSSLTTNAKT